MFELLLYFVICLYVFYQSYKQPLSLGFTNYPHIEFMVMYLICMLGSYTILRIIGEGFVISYILYSQK